MSNKNLTFILLFICVIALIIETTIISFPFIYFIGATLLVLMKKIRLYIMVFVIAFFIDALRVSNFGYTPLFLLATVASILFYEKFSGSDDFVVISLVIAVIGFIYAHFMSYSIMLTIVFYALFCIGIYIYMLLKSRRRQFI